MKWNAALVGLGQIGMGFELDPLRVKPASHLGALKALSREFTVKAVCDIQDARVREAREFLQEDVSGFSSWHHIFDSNPIDLLVVATSEHPDIVIQAAKKPNPPKIIFCEKPLADTWREADKMVEVCKENGVTLLVNHTRRWEPNWNLAYNWVLEGEIGEMGKMVAVFSGDWMRVGSHMADVANWFMVKDVSVTRLDAPYLVFEASFYGADGAVHVLENGLGVELLKSKDSSRYTGVKELKLERGVNVSPHSLTQSPMKNAYEHIADTLEGKTTNYVPCRGEDGAKAVALVNVWMWRGV